jgi:hypothetical protein
LTGVPTQITIADLVLEALRNSRDPVPDNANLPFYYLGAVAPALGDFLPTRVEDGTGGTNAPYFAVWLPLLQLLAGTSDTPGLATNLRTIKSRLQRFSGAVRDEHKLALLDMKAELLALPGVITALRKQVASLDAIRTGMATSIVGARPLPKRPPTGGRHPRDVIHGHGTGTFWGQLRRRAADSGDPRLQAFGLGVTVGYAGALCGNPFLNGIVGAPYRNQWWRHRWVSQHVDAWVWGYYRTRERVRAAGREIVFGGASTGVPTPPYAAWNSIPGAELQSRFTIGGITPDAVFNAIRDNVAVPAHLPDELVTLWLDCYSEAVGDPPSPGVDAAGLQGAYALTWLITWITSSAELLGATPPDRINEPDDCGDRPDWVTPDGSVVVGGTLITPPTPSQPSPSVAQLASAVALAILGVVSFLLGGVVAGIALIAAAVAVVDEATDPDWNALRCYAGWVGNFIERFENAARDLLTIGALGPPYAVQLAHNEIQFVTFQEIVPAAAALRTCRSPSADEEVYPASEWRPTSVTMSNWTQYPTEPAELPTQISYAEGSWWPLHFVDGFSFVANPTGAVPPFSASQDNPLVATAGLPIVLDGNEQESRMRLAELGGIPQGLFGNAVDVSVALIRVPQAPLPDWDLDGDRGLGWPTWLWLNPPNPALGQPGVVVRQ